MIYTITLSPALDKTIYLKDFQFDKINMIQESYIEAAGKGINSAKVLNLLGSDVTSIAILGGDNGKQIEEMLGNQGLKQKNIFIDENTRMNIKILNFADGSCTEINENTSNISDEAICEFDEIFEDILENAEIVTLSGRLPSSLPKDFYAKYIKKAKSSNIKVLLDTSGEALKYGVKEKPWCIKPNIHEFCEYFGVEELNEKNIVEKCKYLNSLGVEVVILTLGKDGLICSTNGLVYRVEIPKVKSLSTVGAGDSFIGGFLSMYTKTKNIEKALKYGSAVSIEKVSKKGTNPIDIYNVDKYFEEITFDVF